jgi:hypothetical protein
LQTHLRTIKAKLVPEEPIGEVAFPLEGATPKSMSQCPQPWITRRGAQYERRDKQKKKEKMFVDGHDTHKLSLLMLCLRPLKSALYKKKFSVTLNL